MASQPSTAPKPSRWGSFLTGIESKLDTILADEDTAAKLANKNDAHLGEQSSRKDIPTIPASGTGASSRTPSTSRAQDRLNEKLAKALANKNVGKKGETRSLSPSAAPSRTASPANENIEVEANNEFEGRDADKPEHVEGAVEVQAGLGSGDVDQATAARHSTDSNLSAPEPPQVNGTANAVAADSSVAISSEAPVVSKDPDEYEKMVAQLRSDNEAAELRRQEETHDYIEKIDALQAKLQYLTREAADIAKTTMETSPSSVEQKLAAKDEKIALLVEEGLKLSQTELKHMTLIKKLRNKSGEDDRSVAELKRNAERHEKTLREAQDRAKRAEVAEKRVAEKVRTLGKLEKDLDSARAERDAKDSLIRDLQLQLSDAISAAKDVEAKANAEALDVERRRVADLTEELSHMKNEKEMAEKENLYTYRELQERSEREKERAKVAEIERQGEHSILESRLEAYRARAEEASAGQGGDVQAKLLRQIETLQNQYAVASENWQGIEGSLLSRVTLLEKERDETAKREGDVRRKAREMVCRLIDSWMGKANKKQSTKSRRMEEDLERANARAHDVESELSSCRSLLSTLQDRVVKSEAESIAAQNDVRVERQTWEARQVTRLEEERSRIKEEILRSHPDPFSQPHRTESATIHNRTRKSSNADRNSPRNSRRIQGLAISGANHDRPLSRQSSSQRIMSGSSEANQTPKMERQGSWDFQSQILERQDSMSTIPQLSVNNGIPETPSIDDIHEEDFFSGIHTPATPPDRTINEIVSVSTAGAGPSVQLVERMSAAVRRLESEKAALKDELTRLFGQRDEAREQVVELIRDNEQKKTADEKVQKLEWELKIVQERYLTTLEMLGEKSERVEELRADVDDLKGMYRELVESTLR